MMCRLPASATVTTRTMQPLPMMTPSIVNAARSLFARNAWRARSQVSFQYADLLRTLDMAAISDYPDEFPGAISISPGVPAAFSLPCVRDRVAEKRDIARLLRRAFLALRRGARATRAQRREKANHCDQACWRDRTSSPVRNARDPLPIALHTRRGNRPGGDRSHSRPPLRQWRL